MSPTEQNRDRYPTGNDVEKIFALKHQGCTLREVSKLINISESRLRTFWGHKEFAGKAKELRVTKNEIIAACIEAVNILKANFSGRAVEIPDMIKLIGGKGRIYKLAQELIQKQGKEVSSVTLQKNFINKKIDWDKDILGKTVILKLVYQIEKSTR